MLPARISEELEDVFSTAETPLDSNDEGEEMRGPLTRIIFTCVGYLAVS